MSPPVPCVAIEARVPAILVLLAHALWEPRVAQRVWLQLERAHYPNDATYALMALLATEVWPRDQPLRAFVGARDPAFVPLALEAAALSHRVLAAWPPKVLVQQLRALHPAVLRQAS